MSIRVKRPGGEPKAVRFRVETDEYVVLSYMLPVAAPPPTLTASEQSVFQAILAGHSNAEIAARRGSAPRTIANQVAAIFQKLGVSSRAELVAKHAAAECTA